LTVSDSDKDSHCSEALDAEPALTRQSISHPTKHSLADFYLRTIYHTQTHIRQIWLLRGALDLANGPWPEQQWG